jgi:hypothetical protein
MFNQRTKIRWKSKGVKVLTTLPETKAASMVTPMPIVIGSGGVEQVTEAAGDLTVEISSEERSAKMQRIWHRSSSNYR